MTEPVWLRIARGYLGQREIAGAKHNPLILRWWQRIRAPFTDDETPWCAGFVGFCLEKAGIKSTRSAAALSYLKFGLELKNPAVGCIAVKKRKGGGHVTFVVGIDKHGNLLCLGGNQNDSVCITAYPRSAFETFRWPGVRPYYYRYQLPLLVDYKMAGSEA